jgi:microsomal dipeptidase-like Zn-dependent dipeptidase
MKRKDFIKKAALLGAASALSPKFLFAAAPENLIGQNAIIDLHCHPSLKAYMLNKKFWKRHLLANPGPNMFHMQEDTHEFSSGTVRGMVATHYLPEGGIETQWNLVKGIWPTLKFLLYSTTDKVEHEDYSNFTQINQMIDTLEAQVHVANDKLTHLSHAHPENTYIKFVIARDFEEFERALKTPDTVVMAHGIEGAHALGRNFPITEKRKNDSTYRKNSMKAELGEPESKYYIRNLEALHARGVCMMTLGHFFANDLVYPVDGISYDGGQFPGMTFSYDPEKGNLPLRAIGTDVVAKMLDIGMVVDITHTTPQARQDVIKITKDANEDRMARGLVARPLVFSHVGAQHIFEKYNKVASLQHFKYYDVCDEEIMQISELDGVIGVIPENFWLTGADANMRKQGFKPADFKYGIKYVIETMKYINSKTEHRKFDNVGIGTDFDGLADNPADLYLNSQIGALIKAMEGDPEINQNDYIAKITSGNALRILRTGWGNKRPAR